MAKSMRATNQNRGAMIRISVIATARCTRQCASSGSAQPVFWSLPIAIHEVCSMKSATMCLAVRSSSHPTSAPTGTDEDMAGNNRADALCSDGLDWHQENWDVGCQRNFLLKTRSIRPLLLIYDTSRAGMHLRGTEKTQGVT